MKCDFRVAYFCFPPINYIPLGHSADSFGHPIKSRFTCWVPGFVPQLPQPPLLLQEMIEARQLFRSERVNLRLDNLYAYGPEGSLPC
jgi:hypothetical protein